MKARPRVVVALGGNALLRRGEPMTVQAQRRNIRVAAEALADLARDHQIVVAHGNGPQVGLLALQAAAYREVEAYPLDVLGAESEGMIGYLIEQELANALPAGSSGGVAGSSGATGATGGATGATGARCATLLTRVEVDGADPAFASPTKPIGPLYTVDEVQRLRGESDWSFVEEAAGSWRRVVPSPLPLRVIGLPVIRLLVEAGVIVICAGGGGIPVVRDAGGRMDGVEAVIDKDRAAGLLATELEADAFLMLTDVEAVLDGWGGPDPRPIRRITPAALEQRTFAAGSMGPKVEAACAFVRATGARAGIGRLEDARAILDGDAGTTVG